MALPRLHAARDIELAKSELERIEPLIGKPVPMPDALAATLARKKQVLRISPVLAELSALL